MEATDVLIRRPEAVRIHLDILEALLREPLSSSQAIRASLSLRFLFDGDLNRVAYDMRHQLKISAPDLEKVPIKSSLVFMCGGFSVGDTTVSPYYLYREPGLRSPTRRQFELEREASPPIHKLQDHKLSAYQKQYCLALNMQPFGREELVRYVANRCGGAHHHDNLNGFETLEHGLTNLGRALFEQRTGLPIVFLEVLGTAFFLINSRDVQELRKKMA